MIDDLQSWWDWIHEEIRSYQIEEVKENEHQSN
jgi:hypothetical protein